MIRLLRRLGRFPSGTVTDYFDAAAEAAFLLDGTAEDAGTMPRDASKPVRHAAKADAAAAGDKDYRRMRKDDLLREAMARGLDVSPRAKVDEIVDVLERSDDA